MPREYHYTKIKVMSRENEQYVLMCDDEKIGAPLEEVAIAFSLPPEDDSMYTMHKHGSYEIVEKWLKDAQDKFRKAGFNDMADELMMIVGRFDVEHLNRVLDTTGYLGRFFEHHGIVIKKTVDVLEDEQKSLLK